MVDVNGHKRQVRVRPYARRRTVTDTRYTRRVPPSGNRLMPRIVELRESLRKRVGAYGEKKGVPLTEQQIQGLETASNIDFEQHFAFQETQAWAHASGIISTDEAQVMYMALGEVYSPKNGGWARDTDLATKIIVQETIFELLTLKRRMR